MKAYVFPGQGAQFTGMGKDLYEGSTLAKNLFEDANEILKFSITDIKFEGTSEELKETKVTQPAIFLHSVILAKVLNERFKPQMVAGHSLGEYSALVCAGSLNFNDALYLLHERGKAMQDAVPVGKGAMLAVLGTKIDEVIEFIKNSQNDRSGICQIANDNAEGQVIISGDIESINKLQIFLNLVQSSLVLSLLSLFH